MLQRRLFDPGPKIPSLAADQEDDKDYVRGENVVGQQMLDFSGKNAHNQNSTAFTLSRIPKTPYLTQHGTFFDNTMPHEYWNVGGGKISNPEVAERWKNAPIQTFSADTPLYSGQPPTATNTMIRPRPEGTMPSLKDPAAGHRMFSVEEMRGQEIVNKPWVLMGQHDRPYLVDGNHRASAMRRRGTGEVQAHVLNVKEFPDLLPVSSRDYDEP